MQQQKKEKAVKVLAIVQAVVRFVASFFEGRKRKKNKDGDNDRPEPPSQSSIFGFCFSRFVSCFIVTSPCSFLIR